MNKMNFEFDMFKQLPGILLIAGLSVLVAILFLDSASARPDFEVVFGPLRNHAETQDFLTCSGTLVNSGGRPLQLCSIEFC